MDTVQLKVKDDRIQVVCCLCGAVLDTVTDKRTAYLGTAQYMSHVCRPAEAR